MKKNITWNIRRLDKLVICPNEPANQCIVLQIVGFQNDDARTLQVDPKLFSLWVWTKILKQSVFSNYVGM